MVILIDNIDGVRNSTVALQPCPSGHITADKKLSYTLPKSSFHSDFSYPQPVGCIK